MIQPRILRLMVLHPEYSNAGQIEGQLREWVKPGQPFVDVRISSADSDEERLELTAAILSERDTTHFIAVCPGGRGISMRQVAARLHGPISFEKVVAVCSDNRLDLGSATALLQVSNPGVYITQNSRFGYWWEQDSGILLDPGRPALSLDDLKLSRFARQALELAGLGDFLSLIRSGVRQLTGEPDPVYPPKIEPALNQCRLSLGQCSQAIREIEQRLLEAGCTLGDVPDPYADDQRLDTLLATLPEEVLGKSLYRVLRLRLGVSRVRQLGDLSQATIDTLFQGEEFNEAEIPLLHSLLAHFEIRLREAE